MFSDLEIDVNGVQFRMKYVEGGTFMMGASGDDSEAAYLERPRHSVTLDNFYIAETQVTQELWQVVMGSNPSHFKGDIHWPVECVSWNDCQKFIEKLNTITGRTFSLPTEAQWEYAARGGKKSKGYKFSGSNSLGDVAWYGGNSNNTTYPVAQKHANELGLYDMTGNVREWCLDWFDSNYYANSPQNNPQGPSSGGSRVLRGGGWGDDPERCRVSCRYDEAPEYPDGDFGLRLSLPV
jgi:formylglycine-generating enzyme required for sulfatase activity